MTQAVINSEYIFPTPYWWVDLTDVDNDKMLKACYELERTRKGRSRSNRGGYQSNDLPHDYSAFTDLLSNIRSISQTIFEEAYAPFYTTSYRNTNIGNYWLNINRKGGYNVEHVHPGCFLSGVYYVNIDPQSNPAPITFLRHSDWIMNHGFYFDDTVHCEKPPFIEHVVSLPPRTGALILFPSHVPHRVETNESDSDRVSISFNILLE
tara:strand:+ start:16 stop:639 length:624 start_codon:yes stop_codon:yes gene_type:complete